MQLAPEYSRELLICTRQPNCMLVGL